jgi:hypothetical protein
MQSSMFCIRKLPVQKLVLATSFLACMYILHPLQVAAQPRSGGSGPASDGGSSSSSGGGSHQELQQQSRPVRAALGSMDAALSQQQVRDHHMSQRSSTIRETQKFTTFKPKP